MTLPNSPESVARTDAAATASEVAAIDYLLGRIWKTQFLAATIVGLVCVIVAIFVARWLTYSDIQELKGLLSASVNPPTIGTCQCDPSQFKSQSSSNNVVISPDPNSVNQLTREVLLKKGLIDDVQRTPSQSEPSPK